MKIERLSWAGIKLSADDGAIVIDALGDASSLEQFMGKPASPLVRVGEPGSVTAALITHGHPDHWDPGTLSECLVPDAPVVCPPYMTSYVAEAGLRPQALAVGATAEAAGLSIEAVPALGGLGEEQVSYVVSDGTHRILHCGDTMWHAYWWAIAEKGPFDVAFLPINGALVGGPYTTGIPAALTPEHAAVAASILKARVACPIHYGLFHAPPHYSQYPDAEDEFVREAKKRELTIRLARDGENIDLEGDAR